MTADDCGPGMGGGFSIPTGGGWVRSAWRTVSPPVLLTATAPWTRRRRRVLRPMTAHSTGLGQVAGCLRMFRQVVYRVRSDRSAKGDLCGE